MSSKVELTGGAFQDSEGNVLANGYLKLTLSQDSSVDSINICAGIDITITLDASGNAVAGQFVWGNDVLSPVNSYYRVTGYTAAGQPAWGPNNQQIIGTPTFNLGSWIPNQVISWTPSTSAVSLLNNGSLNSSQNRLNLESTGATITITDEGGGNINLESSGGGTEFSTPGQGWFSGGQSFMPIGDDTGGFWTPGSGTVFAVQLILESKWVISKLAAMCVTGSNLSFTAGLYSEDGNTKLIDAGAGAFSLAGSQRYLTVTLGSPVTLPAGIYWFAFGAPSGANGSVVAHELGTWVTQLINGIDLANPQVTPTRIGIAANTLTGGNALPSTLGVVTALDHTNPVRIPAVIFIV